MKKTLIALMAMAGVASAWDNSYTNTEFNLDGSTTSSDRLIFDGNAGSSTITVTTTADVTIGESVTAISHSVFGGCDNLNSITFEDSETWYSVSREDNWHNATGGSLVTLETLNTLVENPKTLKENTTQYWYKK